MTELDRRLAAALVNRGILNRWQTTQLLEGRTKFTLGSYWILNAIGKGGYGHVFLGCEYKIDVKKNKPHPPKFLPSDHVDYKPPVALKVLPLTKSTAELSERFRNEITLQKRLRHPNLVRFIDSGHDGNVDYMVHEFIDGGDVKTLLQKEGVIPYDISAAIIVELAKGVQYLHEQGIIHRDIKPANILISSDGKAKLIDLGLSVSYDVNGKKSGTISLDESSQFEKEIAKMNAGKIAGTVDYVAPDQIRNPNEPTPVWDIYSIGCSFYQLLTGRTPFPKGELKQKLYAHVNIEPTDPRVFNQSIPFDVAEIALEMLEKDPTKRIQSAKEIVEKLSSWIPPDGLAGQLICTTENAIPNNM
jgi:serine/threonine protein kinase